MRWYEGNSPFLTCVQCLKKHPEMPLDSPVNLLIPAGEISELIWKYTDVTNLDVASLIPCHREARMSGIIMHDHLAAL